MRNPFDPLVARLVDRSQRTDRMLVAHDHAHWRAVLALDLAMFLGAVVGWATLPVTSGTWLGVLAAVVVGLQIGRAGIAGLRRAQAYRSGWLAGRVAFVSAMAEAQRRGMRPSDWLAAELARDYAVMGLDPHDLPDLDA
jgi:hypothetical protein